MYFLSSLALLVVIAAPATSTSISTVVSTTTRKATSIATHYGEKARLLAKEQKQNRRAADSYDDFKFTPELCPLLSLVVTFDYYDDDEVNADIEADFMKSCNIGCDDAQENIVTTCLFTGEMCDEADEFCTNEISVIAMVSFDFHDISQETCVTHTKVPEDVEGLKDKKSCLSQEIEIDGTPMLDMFIWVDPDLENMLHVTDCGFTVGDEVCECSICNDGLSGDLKCPNIGIISEECIDFSEGMTDLDVEDDFGDATPSVVRFAKMVPSGEGGLRR